MFRFICTLVKPPMFILLCFAPFIIRLSLSSLRGFLGRKKDGATQFFDRSLFVSIHCTTTFSKQLK